MIRFRNSATARAITRSVVMSHITMTAASTESDNDYDRANAGKSMALAVSDFEK